MGEAKRKGRRNRVEKEEVRFCWIDIITTAISSLCCRQIPPQPYIPLFLVCVQKPPPPPPPKRIGYFQSGHKDIHIISACNQPSSPLSTIFADASIDRMNPSDESICSFVLVRRRRVRQRVNTKHATALASSGQSQQEE
jgi:hypothetical protein